jgi:signal peptidase II
MIDSQAPPTEEPATPLAPAPIEPADSDRAPEPPAAPEPPRAADFPPATWREKLLPFLITAGVLAADQLTKYLVETRIPLYGSWAPILALEEWFRIVHTANTGAVFGLFQGTGMIFAGLAVVVAIAIVYFNLTLPGGHWLIRIALGLQLGGALGNFVDRMRQGHVTDFIDVGPWYIFNLADMAITSGIILFAIAYLREYRKEQQAMNATAEPPLRSADSEPKGVE